LIFGASRGIGREIALTLAKNNMSVIVSAKSVTESSKTPGTIFSVADEIKSKGGNALPIPCDVRNLDEIESAVKKAIQWFGHLDYVIYNSGAIHWATFKDTPTKRFDLMNSVNVRGCYHMIQTVLPHFLERKSGLFVNVSPPIYDRFLRGKLAYSLTKFGMTLLTKGLANELKNTGVNIVSLWPATTIESHVTAVKNVPLTEMRKATIFADAVLAIMNDPNPETISGSALLDEDYLRTRGVVDFSVYRCSNVEPPRSLPFVFPSLALPPQPTPEAHFQSLRSRL